MAYGDILRTFDDAPDTVLVMDTDDVKIICTTIDGIQYRFNAEWIPDETVAWMASIFERHMKACHERAVKSTKAVIRTEYFKFLSNFGGC